MNLNYKMLAILSGFTFAQIEAMEGNSLSKLMPIVKISKKAEDLIAKSKCSINKGEGLIYMNSTNEHPSSRTSVKVKVLQELLIACAENDGILPSRDYPDTTHSESFLQAFLHLIPDAKRDANIKNLIFFIAEEGTVKNLDDLKNCGLQADQFDKGFLETVAELAEFKGKASIKESLLALIGGSAKKKECAEQLPKKATKEPEYDFTDAYIRIAQKTTEENRSRFGGGGFIDSF